MDEVAKQLIATSPIAGVVLYLGTMYFQVWKIHLRESKAERREILKRIRRIETKLGIPLPADDLPPDEYDSALSVGSF